MPNLSAFSLVLFQLLGLGAITLVLHRFTARIGMTPLLVFLGMLTAGLQMRLPGTVLVTTGDGVLNLALGSFTLLPVLLMGLLVIYIFNGTHQARMTLLGMLIITLVIAITRMIPSVNMYWLGFQVSIEGLSGLTVWQLVSSALTLLVDLLVLIVAYQAVCNLRGKFPSRTGAAVALLLSIWVDAAAFSALSSPIPSVRLNTFWFHLTGKSAAVLALWPLLLAYLTRFAPRMPESAAGFPRPTLDIFTTAQRIEARARFHFNMLRTLTQIDQLILRTEDPEALLRLACKLLVERRNFSLVWIGLLDEGRQALRAVAQAGTVSDYVAGQTIAMDKTLGQESPPTRAVHSGNAAIAWNVARDPANVAWRRQTLEHDFSSMAVFPMRHAGRVLGALNIYTQKFNTFDQEEIALLQELGDDLAYALISLEARRQQTVLQTAAERMQDGLIILDLRGAIIYYNPAIAIIFDRGQALQRNDLQGMDFRQLIESPQDRETVNAHFSRLFREKQVEFEFEQSLGEGNFLSLSVSASLVPGSGDDDGVIVVNIHDTTRRRRYERQLLSLNKYVTEMMQALEVEDLVEKIFQAGERLLEADAEAVYLADVAKKTVTAAFNHKLPEAYLEHLRKGYAGLPGDKVLSTGQPVLISDTAHDPEFGERISFLPKFGFHAAMVLPVIYQEVPLGTLVAYYKRRKEFSEEDVQTGLTLSRTLAIVIQNIRLFEAEHNQRRFAEALTKAAAAVNTSLELDRVLDHILEQTLQVVGCSSVNLMLIEGEQARVTRARDISQPERTNKVEGKVVPLSIPTLKQMMANGKSLVIADTQDSELWSHVEDTEWIHSYAAAPLIVHGETIGFLSMNSDRTGAFSEGITRRIQAFAEMAATAIQNARLYESLRGHSREMEARVVERTVELLEAKEQIEKIILSVPDAVFVLDEDGQLVQTNPAGAALLADSQDQKIDLFAEEFLHLLDGEARPEMMGILEINDRSYQALASPLPESSAHSGKVVVFRDVTRFQELDRLKTQFVSDVSHELRTPLTNLSIYLDLLTSVEEPRKRGEYLDILRRETVRLTHLIEDLLTISRLEASRLEINIQPVDVRRVVRNLTDDRATMAANKSLQLSDTSAGDVPLAWADPRLLTQVLSNLLTNALNYTVPPGKIEISVEQQRLDGDRWVRICVQDSGVGIEPAEIENLFKRFYRGKASKMTGASGTGLGLAISKEIIDRLGGSISVESQPGQGSCFMVWLRPVL